MLSPRALPCSCPKAPLCSTSGDQLLAKATYSLAHSQGRLARGGTERCVPRGSCGAAFSTAGRHDSLFPPSLLLLLFFLRPSPLSPHYLSIIAPDTSGPPLLITLSTVS